MSLKNKGVLQKRRCKASLLLIILAGCYWLFILHAVSFLPYIKDCLDLNTNCVEKNDCSTGNCACANGFEKTINNTCVDVDECAEKPCGKFERCHNTIGSFQCNCIDNYSRLETKCVYDPKICEVKNSREFPHCRSKIRWLQRFSREDICYKQHYVTGSNCSFAVYLSEVERECPLLPGRQIRNESEFSHISAEMQTNLQFLTNFVLHDKTNQEWMIDRISTTWKEWMNASLMLQKKQEMKQRPIKKIIIFIGILVQKNWGWAKNAKKGGPLGELVQWSDIVAACYILGHKVFVPSSIKELKSKRYEKKRLGCGPAKLSIDDADIIYSDAHGVNLLKKEFKIKKFRCKLRIVDSFGTEARYNHVTKPDDVEHLIKYNSQSNVPENKYGYFDFKVHLNQIMTMFPHSPDNSFLGFAVGSLKALNEKEIMQKKVALIYGKLNSQLKGSSDVLKIIRKYLPVEATVSKLANKKGPINLPEFVTNHGLMKWNDYQSFLKSKVKIFIGLGFPFEGPAPLEAIMSGAVFLNPLWKPPLSVKRDRKFSGKWFFEGKPFLREFTSQHSYMEEFVKPPHSYNVDYSNQTELEEILKHVLQEFDTGKIKPHIPYEFTHEGFLQRINSFINKQDFCSDEGVWVPRKDLISVKSKLKEPCSKTCTKEGLICENSLFRYLNNYNSFIESGIKCNFNYSLKSYHAPFYDIKSGGCALQDSYLFYSCVDYADNYIRLCPCRRFIKEQIALYYNYI